MARVLFRGPSVATLDALVTEMTAAQPTYTLAMTGPYRRDAWSRPLASSTTWEQGKQALRDWRAHRGAGVRVHPPAPPTEGQTVAIAIRFGPVWVLASCRVTEIVDNDEAFGFTYATLPIHPEQGEESFVLRKGAGRGVTFHISATSKAADPLVKLAGPLSRGVQQRIAKRYLNLDGLA